MEGIYSREVLIPERYLFQGGAYSMKVAYFREEHITEKVLIPEKVIIPGRRLFQRGTCSRQGAYSIEVLIPGSPLLYRECLLQRGACSREGTYFRKYGDKTSFFHFFFLSLDCDKTPVSSLINCLGNEDLKFPQIFIVNVSSSRTKSQVNVTETLSLLALFN